MQKYFLREPCAVLRSSGRLAILMIAFAANLAVAATCRVTTAGSSGGDGSDWASQAMDLSTALASATCEEVWVTAGIYKPTSDTDRTISFRPVGGAQIYGGFAGGETLRSERDPRVNPTVLSGDIDNNDTGVDGIDADASQNVGNNSYHVVYFNAAAATGPILADTVLDGFVITGGNANGTSSDDLGGGAYCYGQFGTHECSPTLRNLSFSGNRAGSGGGLCNDGSFGLSSPTLINVTFNGNAAFNGGAMTSIGYQGHSSPTFENVTFVGNSATSGGALYNAGYDGTSTMLLNNVTFSANSADNAGAIYNEAGTATLNNVIAWGDTASIAGAETLNAYSGSLTINDTVMPACTNDNTCNNIITSDPLLGPLQDNGGFTRTQVPAGSAVDAGNDSTCLADDQRGVARPQGSHCDIGAVEVVVDEIFIDGFEVIAS
ncbi:MAG: choice-of-anchor Q domain-containing protein [Rudaea sp.]